MLVYNPELIWINTQYWILLDEYTAEPVYILDEASPIIDWFCSSNRIQYCIQAC